MRAARLQELEEMAAYWRRTTKADVLEYWQPMIDWSCFAQGAISDGMWLTFKDLVLLCHCCEHWCETVRSLRITRPPLRLYTPDGRKAHQHEWKRSIRACEGHMHRAAYLADEKIAEMSYLIGPPADKGNPDWNLYWAASLSIGRSLGHERARYKSVAFDAFDAAELSEFDPSVIATQWLTRAGYIHHQPRP